MKSVGLPRERTLAVPKAELRKMGSGHAVLGVFQSGALSNRLYREYGRRGLCLKVFQRPLRDLPLEEFHWGVGPTVVEAAQVQNVAAMYGLAPRVFDVVRVRLDDGDHAAQVTEFVTAGRPPPDVERPTMEVLREKCTLNTHYGAPRTGNWRGGRNPVQVDWEHEQFATSEIEKHRRRHHEPETAEYRACFDGGAEYRQRLWERASRGRSKRAYQAVPELGIEGRRDMAHRVKVHRLDEIDFEGKTVLDLGCSLGAFSRYAWDRGAKRIVGADSVHAELAYEISNMLCYWNLDFLKLQLEQGKEVDQIAELTGIERFDVVFCFAMVKRISGFAREGGLAPWLDALVGDVLCLESHDTNDVEKSAAGWRDKLTGHFREVEFLGRVEDDRRRFGFRCRR